MVNRLNGGGPINKGNNGVVSFGSRNMNKDSINADLNLDYQHNQQALNQSTRAPLRVDSEGLLDSKMESTIYNLDNTIKNPNLQRHLKNNGHGPKMKMYFLSQNKYSEIGIGRIRAIPETPVAFNRNLFPRTQTSEACPQQVTSMFPGKPTTMYRITMFHIERMARASGRQIQTPQVTWTRANCITGLSKISAT